MQKSAKASIGGVVDLGETLKVTSTIIKNYSLQWGAAESVQDKIQLTAKNSGTKKRGLSVALKKHLNRVVAIGCGGNKRHASCCACDNFFVILFANSG